MDLALSLLLGLVKSLSPQQWDAMATALTDAPASGRSEFAAQHPAFGELIRYVESQMAGALDRSAGAHMSAWLGGNTEAASAIQDRAGPG